MKLQNGQPGSAVVNREQLKKIVWAQAETHTKLIICCFPLTATELHTAYQKTEHMQDVMQCSAVALKEVLPSLKCNSRRHSFNLDYYLRLRQRWCFMVKVVTQYF